MIKIIVSLSNNRVIGNDNSLIWKLPNDLKRFKRITNGESVVMGRKTHESIGKALSNRRNVVITRQSDYHLDDCEVVSSLEEAVLLCGGDCFIIGGGEIYKQSIDIADKIYLTLIDGEFEGDTYFPDLGKEWVEVIRETHQSDDKNEYKHAFIEYERYNF